jgi:hypothetical protein
MSISIRLTSTSKYFHKWKMPYTLYKYTTLDVQEIVVMLHHLFCKDLLHQKGFRLFLSLVMFCFNNFFKNDQASLNSQPWTCVYSIWVFIKMFPLNLLYLIKKIHKWVNHWHKTLAHACFLMFIIHYNIYTFSKSSSKLSWR